MFRSHPQTKNTRQTTSQASVCELGKPVLYERACLSCSDRVGCIGVLNNRSDLTFGILPFIRQTDIVELPPDVEPSSNIEQGIIDKTTYDMVARILEEVGFVRKDNKVWYYGGVKRLKIVVERADVEEVRIALLFVPFHPVGQELRLREHPKLEGCLLQMIDLTSLRTADNRLYNRLGKIIARMLQWAEKQKP